MAHKRKILVLVLVLAVFAQTPGQSASTARNEIRKRAEAGETGEVLTLLEQIRGSDAAAFRSGGFAYLAGRSFEAEGDAGRAAKNYLEATKGGSVLKVYAFWRLSKLLRRSGNLPAERLFLLSALALNSGSAAETASAERLPQSWFESGNHDSAAASAAKGFGGRKGEAGRESLVLIGRASRRLGDSKAASEAFRRVIRGTPDRERPDDLALAAVEGLDLIEVGEAEYGRRVPALSTEEHFERGNIYQHNRRFRSAALHYKAIVEKTPGSPLAAPSAFRIGRGFAQERDHHNAIAWFERVLEQYAESAQAPEALYQSANAFANVGKAREAVSRFERFIALDPGSPRAADAYLNIIDIERDAGESALAISAADRMLANFSDADAVSAAHFAKARIRIARSDWPNALRDLEALESNGRGTGMSGEAGFLKGYVLEKLGRHADAIDAYLQIPPGFRNYYGSLATGRLRSIAGNSGQDPAIASKIAQVTAAGNSGEREAIRAAEAAFRLAVDDRAEAEAIKRLVAAYWKQNGFEMPQPPKIPGDPGAALRDGRAGGAAGHGRIADRLLAVGVFDEGAVELELFLEGSRARPDAKVLLAETYRKGGMVTRSVALAEGRWKDAPAGFPAEAMPDGEIRALYPAPFKRWVLEYSKAEGLDPRFVLSIMRQESRFDPDVKSSAAARGLMQFIPSTAAGIAEELAIEDFVQDDLYDPAAAIRIGSRYLGKLFGDFPDQPAAVAASYNAGEDRVKKWYRRAGAGEPERYVPEIRFDQTRDYVAKVMNNYRIYRMLFDENLEITVR